MCSSFENSCWFDKHILLKGCKKRFFHGCSCGFFFFFFFHGPHTDKVVFQMIWNFTVTVRVTHLNHSNQCPLTGSRPIMPHHHWNQTYAREPKHHLCWVLRWLSPNRQQVTAELVVCLTRAHPHRPFGHLQRSLIEMGPWTTAIWTSLSLSVSTPSPVLMLTGWLCCSCALMCEEPADGVFAEQARHQGIAVHSSLPRSECG